MTINANIKSDACSCPHPVHFLKFRGRHLQFILSISGDFISPLGNWRKLTNANLLFEEANGSLVICGRDSFVSGSRWKILQCPKHRLLQWSEVHALCIVYELCLWRKYQHVKLFGLYFKLFSDSREEMSWSLAAADQYQRFKICWDVLMANFQIKLHELSKRRLFRYGVPFLVFVLGGSFGLKEFTRLRWT
jgi:hypothetical protein